jgi:hypothetical protein
MLSQNDHDDALIAALGPEREMQCKQVRGKAQESEHWRSKG